MSGTRPAEILRHLEHAAGPTPDATGDGDLLAAFARHRDQAAFAVLVRRHGPMVLAVCRRITNHPQDAEDAFQAVFLVLARRAASVYKPDLLGNWLYGVAVRVAQKARRTAARRRAREVQAVNVPEPSVPPADPPADIGPVLHEELARLPACYREAIVLCDLRGVSRAEAAKALGVPEGTLSSRLAGGRKRLADRLARRGVALSAAAVPVALSEGRVSAGVPDSLVSTTCGLVANWSAGAAVPGAVARLAQGGFSVRKTLLLGLFTTAVAAAGVGFAARPADPPAPADPLPKPDPRTARAEPVSAAAPVPKPGEKGDGFTTKPALRAATDLSVKGVRGLDWSADGKHLAVSARREVDGKEKSVVRVLDVAGGKVTEQQTIMLPPAGSFVGFTSDGTVITDLRETGLVSGRHRLEFWNPEGPFGPMGAPGGAPALPGGAGPAGPTTIYASDKSVDLDPEPTTGYAFAPGGKTYRTVAQVVRDNSFIKLSVREVSVETGQTLRTLFHLDGEFHAFQLSGDGSRLVVSNADAVLIYDEAGKLVASAVHRGLDPQINPPRAVRTTLAVSPNGKVVFVNRGIDRPVLLNGNTGDPLPAPEGVELAESYAGPGNFTADGRLVAVLVSRFVKKEGAVIGVGKDGRPRAQTSITRGRQTLEVWDTRTGKVVKAWPAGSATVAFHPTRPILAVAEPNGDATRLGLWDFSAEVPKGK